MPNAIKGNCHHHLRCMWEKRALLGTAARLKDQMKDDMVGIDPRPRVATDPMNVCRAIDKFFCLTANHPKGDGEKFVPHMGEHQQGELLVHVLQASSSRQDLCFDGATPVCWN